MPIINVDNFYLNVLINVNSLFHQSSLKKYFNLNYYYFERIKSIFFIIFLIFQIKNFF